MDIDEALAQQWLTNVSCYRLSAYWYPARTRDERGARSDSFHEGTAFKDVVALYEAGRRLRTLIHDGMERIEITMRARIDELLCADDPLAYNEPHRFRSNFNHALWIETARRRIDRARGRNESIRHYRDEYGGRHPFWVLAEVLDFSDLSRLFQGLHPQGQRSIAEGLGIVIDLSALSRSQRRRVISSSPLTSWLEQLTIVRNTCAHHGRVWNKHFIPATTAALRTQHALSSLPEGQSERIFGTLTVMAYPLRVTSPGTTWPEKVATLVNDDLLPNPLVSPGRLGVPASWSRRL